MKPHSSNQVPGKAKSGSTDGKYLLSVNRESVQTQGLKKQQPVSHEQGSVRELYPSSPSCPSGSVCPWRWGGDVADSCSLLERNEAERWTACLSSHGLPPTAVHEVRGVATSGMCCPEMAKWEDCWRLSTAVLPEPGTPVEYSCGILLWKEWQPHSFFI